MTLHAYISFDQRDSLSPSARLIVFNHVMKCAGMSLLANLAGHFGQGHYPDKVDHYTDWQALVSSGFTARDEDTLSLGGHAAFGAESLFKQPRQVLNVTMLREPFSLCRSLYRYSQLHFAKPQSFRQFVMESYPANLMVKTLADGDPGLARERLAHSFFHFGLVERFGDGLAMLRHHLGLPHAPCLSVNASLPRLVPVEFDDSLEQAFRTRNSLDSELYEFARSLFEERFSALSRAHQEAAARERTPQAIAPAASEDEAGPILNLLRQGETDQALHAMDRLPAERFPYREKARHLARVGRVDEAIGCLDEGMLHHPWLEQHKAEICERAGRTDQAADCVRDILDAVLPLCAPVPEDAFANRLAYDMLINLARLEYAKGGACEELYRRAHRIMPMRMEPKFGGVRLDAALPLEAFMRDGGRALVLRFGPMPVVNAFCKAVGEERSMDLLIQPSEADNAPRNIFDRVFCLPADRFVFEDHALSLEPVLWNCGYDSVVVICNDQDLLTYDQVFRLCSQLNSRSFYAYPMANRLVRPREMRLYDIESIVERYHQGNEVPAR
jgi:tetratricopeptide (TPR) repeat protein